MNKKTRITQKSLNYINNLKNDNLLGTNAQAIDLLVESHKRLLLLENKLKIINIHSLPIL